jgi:hypothetical protein
VALARACEEHAIPALFRSDHYENPDAGVSRVMCQQLLHEDLEAVALLAELARVIA